MKRILFVLIVACSLVTVYQTNTVAKATEDIDLISVEALAQEESGGGGTSCRWHSEKCPSGSTREVCVDNGDGSSCSCGSTTRPC